MITEDDARNTLEFDDYFIVQPSFHWWSAEASVSNGGKTVKDGFRYSSDNNPWFLSVDEMKEILKD
jgi:UDP-N-acetylglucosamine 4,6-dehydratase